MLPGTVAGVRPAPARSAGGREASRTLCCAIVLPGIPFGDHPLKLERFREDLAWPLRKDDTHKSGRDSAPGPEMGLPAGIFAGLLPGKHRNRASGRPTDGPISVLSR